MIAVLIPVVLAMIWVLTPPSAATPGRGPRGRPRPVRAGALEVARMIEQLATVISTGSSQRGAWRAVAGSLPEGELAELARAVAAGADPRRAGPSRLAGTELISTLAAALTICERTGAPTAGVLQNLADALRDLHDASLARRTAFAGPRSTARILLVLPAAGLALGMLLGGDPLRLLISSPIGNLLAAVGGAATVIGWWWMRRLVRLASALEAGIPAALASSDLPPPLAALGESAVLAESSGADLAQVLRSAARDTRRSRARQAEERAAHLGVRLVLPTGVALLPAFVVLGIVPTVMSLLGGTLTLTAAGTVTP